MGFFPSKNSFAIYDSHWHGHIQGLEAKAGKVWPRKGMHFIKAFEYQKNLTLEIVKISLMVQ